MTITNGRLTRRNVVQGSAALGAGMATAGMLGRAPGALAARQDEDEGVRGGTLRIGSLG